MYHIKQNIMTVQETLQNSLILYPSVNKNKFDVYNHLFLTNGNGYNWIDGELVVIGNTNRPVTIEDGIESAFDFHMSDERLINCSLIFSRDYLKKQILSIINWEERSKIFVCDREEVTICQYSKILHIPNDVKPDWLEAAKEMYGWLVNNIHEVRVEDRRWIKLIEFPTI